MRLLEMYNAGRETRGPEDRGPEFEHNVHARRDNTRFSKRAGGSMSSGERERPGEISYAAEAKKVHSGPFGQPWQHRCVVQGGRLLWGEVSWTGEGLLARALERLRRAP